MDKKKSKQALVGVIVLLLTVSAFAADKNSTTIKVFDPVRVSGKTLAPGEYKVTWEGSGAGVQVSFLQGKKVVATTAGKFVDRSTTYQNTATVTRQDGSGGLELVEILPQGKSQALQIGGTESATGQQ